MVDHRLISLLAGVLALAGIQGANAQETGGVRIKGTVNNVTTVRGADNIATGSNAKAYMSIGSVGAGVKVNGNLKMHVDADTESPTRPMVRTKPPFTSIGSVHEGAKATGDIVVHTGDVTNVSDGSGEASCVIIGSKGQHSGVRSVIKRLRRKRRCGR